MFQVTFSDQSLSVLNDLSQGDQLKLMDTLSSLPNTILKGKDSGIGKFNRGGKLFYRLRIDDFRVYFEKIDIALHCHFILPKNSPPIISDYHSKYGVLGGSRSNPRKHGGVDFYQIPGEKILAAADGKVYGLKNKDKCVGNQFAIYFGKSPEGTRLYATHMHVGKIHVKKGDIVKRGQHVADGGDLVKTRCGGGMEHLHFHMSKRKGSNPNAWGTWRFLGEPSGWINPHKYWTGGIGKPECFVEGRKYPDGLLTLPVECKN